MSSWYIITLSLLVTLILILCAVLQDAVNRRIAMSMMIEAAKAADQTQFILITPQDMGVSHLSVSRYISHCDTDSVCVL